MRQGLAAHLALRMQRLQSLLPWRRPAAWVWKRKLSPGKGASGQLWERERFPPRPALWMSGPRERAKEGRKKDLRRAARRPWKEVWTKAWGQGRRQAASAGPEDRNKAQ